MLRVILIDSAHEILVNELQSMGFACDFFEGTRRSEIEKIIGNYEGAIIRSKVVFDRQMIDKAHKLKFIARVGAGMESIDVDYAAKKSIVCLNSPEGNRDAVAEHALGMLLSLMNHLNQADRQIRQGLWLREENRGMEIKGKTVAIIGYGNMGRAFAQRLSGFEASMIAYDKYKKKYSDSFVKETDMETIFREAHILSLHVPLTEETYYMVDYEFLSRFRNPIILINTSRGHVVKTADLVTCLKNKKVIAAALDVLEYEPHSFETLDAKNLPDDFAYLQKSDNVLLTPHVAGWTTESKIKLAQVLADKIRTLNLTS